MSFLIYESLNKKMESSALSDCEVRAAIQPTEMGCFTRHTSYTQPET